MGKDNDETKDKKQYLWNYQEHVRRIKRIEEELAELRAMKIYPSGKAAYGMPHGSSTDTDLSGYIAEKERMEEKLIREMRKRVQLYAEITGLEWWDIAEKMRYGERQVYRIHGRALKNLQIPKRCQSMSVNVSRRSGKMILSKDKRDRSNSCSSTS